ncbi:MAG: hypothetical protein ACYTEZ_14005 [Planctomycetota bacterium]|jgi:hypothetical protein
MQRTLLSILATLGIFFAVPFVVYSAFAAVTGLQPPEEASVAVFFSSVLVQKAGHAVVFVLLFRLARGALGERWLLYAALWWLLFALNEVGQAILPSYSWQEAAAGIVAEAIYFPLAALATRRLLAPARGR